MSKARRARKKGPITTRFELLEPLKERKAPAEASDEIVVYVPEMGFVKVGELKAKLAKEVKPKITTPPLLELENAVAAKVIENGGRVTRAELGDILTVAKQESGRKRGVTLSKLITDGFLARIKVPRMRAFYVVTEEGAKKIGVEAKGKS